MSSEPPLNLQQAPPDPELTAQRSRRARIQIAGYFVVFLPVLVYAFYGSVQQYSRNPTNENLLIAVIMTSPFLGWLYWLTKLLVPKVEFFENHLVERSLRGFSRKRSCQEITSVEAKYDHLFVTFNGLDKIALHKSEIKLEDLARWLAERDVSAAHNLKWEPREPSEDWGPQQQAVEAAILQSKATPSPEVTTQEPLQARILQAAFWGALLLLNVIVAGVFAQAYFRNPTAGLLFFTVFMTLANGIWLFMLALSLVHKKEFYEDHILMRSLSGRSRRRSYQEITNVEVSDESLIITFNDLEHISLLRTGFDVVGFARWLADRGVTAARDLKVEPRLEESLADQQKIFRLR